MSYSTSLTKLLESLGAKEGSKLSVESGGRTYIGTLMPHHEFSGSDIMIIKLASGYNIGVKVRDDSVIKVIGQPEANPKKEIVFKKNEGLPKVTFIGTGGTISSNADNRTGAVQPSLPIAELIASIPELTESVNISVRQMFSVFSENMNAEHWQELAKVTADEINGGADAIVILHGTDTMGYTAAALSFMLGDVPKPVVLVGAQRSPDRPSSDAPSNITAAVRFCIKGKTAGVFVVMHHTLEDDSFAVHAGTRVRKMHTSRRDAFESINVPPVAIVDENGKIEFKMKVKNVTLGKVVAKTKMERSTILLQYYPGMDPALFEGIVMKSKGIVISGTGLGHVGESMVPLIKRACDNGSVVVITSQCLNGRTNLNVYDTGRDMLTAGAIAVLDMLPETAYVKLMWALANSKNAEGAKKLMMAPIAEEMGDRRFVDE